MKVAIHQPNFLPWSGYFHKINFVDTFVFLDDVQLERGKTYTKRAKILFPGQEKWLTIPLTNQSDLIKIKAAKVDSNFIWKMKHLKTLEINYIKHPFFVEIFSLIEDTYRSDSLFLVDYNIPLIIEISRYLNINTTFKLSSEITFSEELTGGEKILEINKRLNADLYFSGKGAGSLRYIKNDEFINYGIKLEWQNFVLKRYKQLNSINFIPGLSIIDLLFNQGKDSINYLNE